MWAGGRRGGCWVSAHCSKGIQANEKRPQWTVGWPAITDQLHPLPRAHSFYGLPGPAQELLPGPSGGNLVAGFRFRGGCCCLFGVLLSPQRLGLVLLLGLFLVDDLGEKFLHLLGYQGS